MVKWLFGLFLLFTLACSQDPDVLEQVDQEPLDVAKEQDMPPNALRVEPTYIDAGAIEGKAEQSCGDGECAEGENECTCAKDCGVCAEKSAAACEYWECTANDACVKQQQAVCCGDAVCSNGESCESCAMDCCAISKTLADFPNIAERFTIVVGEGAEAQDVVTAANLANALKQLGIRLEETKLDREVPDLTGGNFIVIGAPCTNTHAAALIGIDSAKLKNQCQLIPEGEGQIRLVPTSANSLALLITGGSSRDVERAAERLIKYQELPLSGMVVKT